MRIRLELIPNLAASRALAAARAGYLILAGLLAVACGKGLPDPVVSKDGYACIPIDGTMVRIPEKTWLTGYSRNSTDGLVHSFSLHATVPDVQPWSQARHDRMYPPFGFGEKLSVYVPSQPDAGRRAIFHRVPSSQFGGARFIEEPSDQSQQGLRRFRQLWGDFDERRAEELTRQFGEEFVARLRENQGKPILGEVFYELIEEDRVKYFIRCDDGKQVFKLCKLSVPRGRTLFVEVEFSRNAIGSIVEMMSRLWAKLDEFEMDGQNFESPGAAKTERTRSAAAGRP